jgi:nitroreductase/NAD-dependent dihydropyrimidine dehydrogenase PreA subunit
MITIDQNKCNNCGICAKICHEYCIDISGGLIKIDFSYCSTCTQCIAICPQDALMWNNIKPEKYNKELLPAPVQIDELLKERRTIRDFKSEKIDRQLLEEIVNYTIYAPTHNFNMRVIIIDEENLINQIDRTLYRFSLRMYRLLYKPQLIHHIIKLITPEREHEYLKAKPKLAAILKRKRNLKTMPSAIIMIIADKRVPLSLESAQYALYNIDLYSQTKGLGCRNLVGNQMFLNKSKSIRNLLGLKKYERIFGTIAIGYPSVKFRNKVNGKQINIQWNN